MTDEAEILRVYRETIRPLYGYVSRRVGGDAALAEDLVQETWMRAVRSWPSRGLPDEPLAWLMTVARNLIASHFRRVRPPTVDAGTIDLEAPSLAPDRPETAAVVNAALARLRPGLAELLEAFYLDGRSTRDLAIEHGVSERAIEGRLHRARTKLAAMLTRLMQSPAARSAGVAAEGTHHVSKP